MDMGNSESNSLQIRVPVENQGDDLEGNRQEAFINKEGGFRHILSKPFMVTLLRASLWHIS